MNKTKCGRSLKETVSYSLLKVSMPFEVHLARKYHLLFVSPLRCSCNINIAAARRPGWHKLQMFMCQQVYTSCGGLFVSDMPFRWRVYMASTTAAIVLGVLWCVFFHFVMWISFDTLFFVLILRNHVFSLVLYSICGHYKI